MAITKPFLRPISSSIICLPYQYGHGWQRERKYASKRDYWLLISVHTSLELGSKHPFPKKTLFKYVKITLFRRDFFWLQNIYAHIYLLFPTFIEKYLIEFGPQTLFFS